MANVEGLRAVGKQLVTIIYAVSDGLDIEDLAPAQALVAGILGAAPDIQDDPDSALLEIGGGLLSALADKRRGPEEPE